MSKPTSSRDASELLRIDGSEGEGGGQILRTSLALSLLTGRPIRFERIRARRSRPGLRAQHLSCVEAARRVGQAEVFGAELGSAELEFRPQTLQAVHLDLDLGTAGSTALVAQTILPALARAPGPSVVRLRGGTHNPLAPSFEFVRKVYLPWLTRLGAPASADLLRPGFFPKGGGQVEYRIEPGPLRAFDQLERGALRAVWGGVYAVGLGEQLAERELRAVRAGLAAHAPVCEVLSTRRARGSGNALLITLESEGAREVVSAYGGKGRTAEAVSAEAVAEASRYLACGAPVGEHGADQLLLLLAIAGGGSFETGPLSGHTTTQLELIPRFLPVRFEREEVASGRIRLSVRAR